MIVAIDGPAGSGKSTIAHEVARRFGFEQLDTGAMYRAVALAALEHGLDLDDERKIDDLAHAVRLTFPASEDDTTRIVLDGTDVSEAIRTPCVDANVSKVAAYPGVRQAMLVFQRAFANGRDVVAEGRDIGTVVFPSAEVKVFLTADPVERARRRVLQRHGAGTISQAELDAEVASTLAALERRDALDASREVAPLRAARDARLIDSTAYSIDDVVSLIAQMIDERRHA